MFFSCNYVLQLYNAIHEHSEARYSNHAISETPHYIRNTVAKYLKGDNAPLCRKNLTEEWINFMIISLRNYRLV